jgi:hypothetical protein
MPDQLVKVHEMMMKTRHLAQENKSQVQMRVCRARACGEFQGQIQSDTFQAIQHKSFIHFMLESQACKSVMKGVCAVIINKPKKQNTFKQKNVLSKKGRRRSMIKWFGALE